MILAGGQGIRLGGIDKGLTPYRGRPLIEWVIQAIQPQVEELLINANRNLDRYATYGVRVIPDMTKEFLGPLAGLQAGLQSAAHEWVLTIPCDTPALPENLVDRLKPRALQPNVEIVVAATAGGWHPTIALYRKSLAQDLGRFIAQGERRVKDWIRSRAHEVVSFDSPAAFANLNVPSDF